MPRKFTNQLIELIDDGVIDTEQLAINLLGWLSDDEVREFAERNGYIPEEYEDEEEEL